MPRIPKRVRDKFESNKLPGGKLKMGRPDWLADEAVDPSIDFLPFSVFNPECIYPEELLRKDKDTGEFDPFAVMGLSGSSTVDDYREVFGHPFTAKARDDFDSFLEGLLQRIRRYNSSLYWLRLFHVKEECDATAFNALPKVQTSTGYRDHTDTAEMPAQSATAYSAKLKEAEEDLDTCVTNLRHFIQSGYAGHEVVVDAVRVNSYVMSVRVTSGPGLMSGSGQNIFPKQVGGSSSSYIYISSPISSYTGS